MIPELGNLALAVATALSVVLAVVPLVGASTGSRVMMAYGRPLAWGVFIFLLASFLILTWAFVTDDFSVVYVAQQSNSLLPMQYKISGVWGGHEGSLLLWLLIMGGWTAAVARFSRNMPEDLLARVLAVMGMVLVGFGLFVLVTSNPFERYLPDYPADGADLNPLLQDFGLILHPPLLYMGYVGFSVAFAFAIAALMSGRLDAAWARWSRPWTNIAWVFLTLGIALGSWWAYYELGWGGWWFWDPVENASFMPWLIGTALVHSLAVTEKRGVFKSWTLLLAIVAFSLCLLGTFLVRSGVLTSVHAFASDPGRGLFVLTLLAITVIGSLTLYAIKAPNVKAESSFSLISRESLLLVNNVILSVVAFTVLLGTLYPLVADALNLGKLSVGPPYFNAFFVPLMTLLTIALGIGMTARWKNTRGQTLLRDLGLAAVVSLIVGLVVVRLYQEIVEPWAVVGVALMVWVLLICLLDIRHKLANKSDKMAGLRRLTRAYWGMIIAHIGVGVTIVGIAMVSLYNEQIDLRMEPGDKVELNGYTFTFKRLEEVQGPNYISDTAYFEVSRDGRIYRLMSPEKRKYTVSGQVMTESAIDPGFFRDLYMALGEPLGGQAWAVRIQYKPFVRWIWLGGILMAVGGLLAALDKRYRKRRPAAQEA